MTPKDLIVFKLLTPKDLTIFKLLIDFTIRVSPQLPRNYFGNAIHCIFGTIIVETSITYYDEEVCSSVGKGLG